MKNEKGNILLIVIGVICILLLIGFFRGEPSFFGTVNYKKILNVPCGLSVSSPESDMQIVFPIAVRGHVNGCGWDVKNGIAGTVQVFDNNGFAISDAVPLEVTDDTIIKPYAFHSALYLRHGPSTGDGSVIYKSVTGLIFAQSISF